MRFAHISDLHLCLDAETRSDVPDDIVAIATEILTDVARIERQLDFVIVSGDLTEDAAPASFQVFERLFSILDTPVLTIPGNHDGPAGYYAYRESSRFLGGTDLSGRIRQIGDLRLIGLDTCIEGATTGRVRDSDLDLLERELAQAETPLLIVMHHAAFPTGQATYDRISQVEGSETLGRILRDAALPPIVLCGHVHRPYVARWNRASWYVGGSPMGPFGGTLPFGDQPLHPTGEHYEYFVHALEGDTHVVTPRVPLGLRGRVTMPAPDRHGSETMAERDTAGDCT